MQTPVSLSRVLPVLAVLAFFLSGCTPGQLTLEPGGVYTDPVAAQADLAIDEAKTTLEDFVAYELANRTALARWPAFRSIADRISAGKDEWIRDAYKARDAYYTAAQAWKAALAVATPSYPADPAAETERNRQRALLKAALAVITSITTQITQARDSLP
jgi:hypothetical protein